ncbi:hypothetical protein A8W25_10970 [Streptomyces sp. ERV7]|uniref:hypothetical protein n=1 Tax=Streptomyces sp. ERV7 TaxID=1322334 RepID=UPI0007F39757|nr:hypothetical protein [Streptomyces sp. ERV7]OAR26008.1 hypothetical protein A8W25_10970 [Streptomyces sp. ERV7]
MLPATHLTLHEYRAAELREEAAEYARVPRPESHRIRTRVGLRLVEWGTRLAQPAPPRHRTRIA